MNKLSVRLKELREEKGLTQAQLGKETGISQQGISQWETGDRTPNIKAIISLAIFFGCTADYLLGIED